MATYDRIVEGIFIDRPNRFIANVEIEGNVCVCHVKNTGRCRELLVPGCKVFLEAADNTLRKTKYDLIAVVKGNRVINMDSQIPNQVAYEWIMSGGLGRIPATIKREVRYGDSRVDLLVDFGENKAFVEVKGVTLEENDVVRFPDAPTERGVKHINELIRCREEGYDAYILFVIQMSGVKCFEPNYVTHAEFGEALVSAKAAGVHVLAVECDVTSDSIIATKEVEVVLCK